MKLFFTRCTSLYMRDGLVQENRQGSDHNKKGIK